MWRPASDLLEPLWPARLVLWVGAVLFFGIGDLATTVVGLATPGVSEQSPIAALLIPRHGIGALAGLKLLVFGVYYLLWRFLPRPYAVVIPGVLTALGVLVTGWNLQVLLA